MRPELLAAAGINHQLDLVADGIAGRLDQQFIELPADAAEWPPAHLDRLEPTAELLAERLAQL